MLEPKITGLVNNCSLNCALPVLMKGINSLATHEAQGTLASIANNPIVHSYFRLKEIFTGFYGIDCQSEFNWHAFNKFLNTYSFYAQELILLPIFRVFVTEQKVRKGAEDTIIEGPEFFSDMQDDGRYNMIAGDVASLLFYQPFGISVEIFTEGSTYTQKLESPHKDYPFGETPSFKIYLKGAHFEIQPHNAPEMAIAVQDFETEIRNLPPKLHEIHEQFSMSQTLYDSDRALSKLVPTVHELVMDQIVNDRAHFNVNEDVKCLAGRQVGDMQDAEPPQEPSGHPKTDGMVSCPVLTAEKYAKMGKSTHSDTTSGRQTFAVILLTLHQEDEHNKETADQLIRYVETLSRDVCSNVPPAAYLLDRLNKSIIENVQLNATPIADIVREVKLHLDYSAHVSAMRKNAKYLKLIKASEKTIEEAWACYRKTKDQDYLTAIQLTQAVTKPEASSAELLKAYEEVIEKLKGKGSWGKKIAGLMCMVLGLALIVTSACTNVVSLGIAVPVSIACVAGGIGLFRFGMDKGLYKKAKQVDNEVQRVFSQGI